MGACCHKINTPLKPVKDVVIIIDIEKEKEFAYPQPKGKIYCLRDLDFKLLLLDIQLEGWNSTPQVRLWPGEKDARK